MSVESELLDGYRCSRCMAAWRAKRPSTLADECDNCGGEPFDQVFQTYTAPLDERTVECWDRKGCACPLHEDERRPSGNAASRPSSGTEGDGSDG